MTSSDMIEQIFDPLELMDTKTEELEEIKEALLEKLEEVIYELKKRELEY